MAERIQLNEQDLEQVAGGKFYFNTYTNEDGSEYMTCRLEDGTTFFCTDNAKKKIATYCMVNGVNNVTIAQVVDYCLTNGYFWS